MRIAIIDDDPSALDRLELYLKTFIGSKAKIFRFGCGEDFLKGWSAGSYDLIILDIFMGKITGMDVAATIRKTDENVRLVFGTSSNEFASESYELNACYYLNKPFKEESIKAMLNRLNMEEIELLRTVKLPDGQSIILRNLIYADFSAHKITFHNKQGNDIVTRLPFTQIEPLLCSYSYLFSPSKGIIVNFFEVSSQQKDSFTMSDGTILPISRRKAKDTQMAFALFRFEQLRKDGVC